METTVNQIGTARFSVRQIKGLLRVAAKDDVRYYLNGVLFDYAGAFAVATDGHALVCYASKPLSDATGTADYMIGTGTAIVDRDALENALKGAKKDDKLTVTAYDDGAVRVARLSYDSIVGDFRSKAIDGRFPDWRNVPPTAEASGEATCFNPQLVLKAALALGDLNEYANSASSGASCAMLRHNGDKPGMMVHGNAFAIVMPMRGADEPLDRERFGIAPLALPAAPVEKPAERAERKRKPALRVVA